MDLTHEDVRKIVEIVDAAQNLDEVELVFGGFRLHLRRDGSGPMAVRAAVPQHAAPLPVPVPVTPEAAPSAAAKTRFPEGVVAIRSPMLGTFYRAPSPGEKPFTEVGARVQADDTVCVIEVMKLFSSIRAGVDGTVVEILVENGGLVEYEQAVILISPDKQA